MKSNIADLNIRLDPSFVQKAENQWPRLKQIERFRDINPRETATGAIRLLVLLGIESLDQHGQPEVK